MSKKLENLRDLFLEQGRELYDASRQEQEELPIIQKAVGNQHLRMLLASLLNTSLNRSVRLKQVFKKLNISPDGEKCEYARSILKDTRNLIARSLGLKVSDAAIINSIQRLNNSRIASLGALASYAKQFGYEDISSSLHETMIEEKKIDEELRKLAEREVNKKALTAIVI